jgi:hypothetical protein
VAEQLLPAVAAVISFINCINRGDLDGRLTPWHALEDAPEIRDRVGFPGVLR